jgi:ubiquinone biosynthesis protein
MATLARLAACLTCGGYHGLRFLGRCARHSIDGGDGHPALLGAALADLFESLGGAFLKVGQVLSTRVDLLPEEALVPLRRLREGVGPMAFAEVARVIERSLGRPLEQLFAGFDGRPEASASIAQVHRAIVRDTGEEVAVKVRRPGVAARLAADARVLAAGARTLGALGSLRRLPLLEAVREVNGALVAQADFLAEARHLRDFGRRYEQTPGVRVPGVVDRLCSADVVTMEYVADTRSLDDPSVDPARRRAAAVTALRLLYRMIFEAGVFHCDPHPANLRIAPDGTVVVVDFGFVGRFPPGQRRAFAQFFVSIATQNVALAAEIVLATALAVPDDLDADGFASALGAVIKGCAGRRVGQFQVVRFVTSLFAVQRRHGIRGSPHFTLAILTLLAFEGVLKAAAPDLDFQQEAVPYLLNALKS